MSKQKPKTKKLIIPLTLIAIFTIAAGYFFYSKKISVELPEGKAASVLTVAPKSCGIGNLSGTGSCEVPPPIDKLNAMQDTAIVNSQAAVTAMLKTKYVNIAKGTSYTLYDKDNYIPGSKETSGPPNYAGISDGDYATHTGDYEQLTDGKYITTKDLWSDKNAVGWLWTRPIVITLDLGKIQPISGISLNTQGLPNSVNWPTAIHMLVSDNGTDYYAQGNLVEKSNDKNGPPPEAYATFRYWTDDLKTHGRYVKLMIDSTYGYFFTDEIEVYKGTSSIKTPFTGTKITDVYKEYFEKENPTALLKNRLNSDLRYAKSALSACTTCTAIATSQNQELSAIKTGINQLPLIDPTTFRAVYPINSLQERIFTTLGKIRQASGYPTLKAWTSNSLDYVLPTQIPSDKNAVSGEISINMMHNEYRSAVINLSNSANQATTATLHININGLPFQTDPTWISVYQVEWTDTPEGYPVGQALTKLSLTSKGYSITIPAGMTRQVWFSFHPGSNIATGNTTLKGNVAISSNASKLNFPLTLHLYPMNFPSKPTLHLGGFDWTNEDTTYSLKPKGLNALVDLLEKYWLDTPWADTNVLPQGYDTDYKINGDCTFTNPTSPNPITVNLPYYGAPTTTNFDNWVARWPNAKQYGILLSTDTPDIWNLGPKGRDTWSDDCFNNFVKSWINFWVAHAATKNIKPEQLIIIPVDEPGKPDDDKKMIKWTKAIKAAQPNVTILEEPIYANPSDATPEMIDRTDIITADRMSLLYSRSSGLDYENFFRDKLLDKAHPHRLNLYSTAGPVRLYDPYTFYRMMAWKAWDMGADGIHFYAFSDNDNCDNKPCTDSWKPYLVRFRNYSPLFLSPEAVTPTKDMEAIREGVEDYEYFVMLKKKYPNNALLKSGPGSVGANETSIAWGADKNRSRADSIRSQILEALK